MLKTQITREELDRLGEDIRRHFELSVVERGLEYQQKGYVYNTEMLPGRSLVAKVQVGDVYSVKLDMDFLRLSECSCPMEGYCPHMAAVFFYAYSVYARPDAFVKDWKLQQEKPIAGLGSSKLHRQSALMPSAQPGSATLKETAAPEAWLDHLRSEFAAFSERHPLWKYDIEEYYTAALQTAVRPSIWWLPGPKKLLSIIGILFTMQQIEQGYEEGGTVFTPRLANYIETVQKLVDKMKEAIAELDVDYAAQRWPEHMQAIGAFVSAALVSTPANRFVRWTDVYRLLWTRLLREPAWRAQERERLEQLLGESTSRFRVDPSESHEEVWLAASSHFDVLADQDDEARRKLDQLSAFKPEEGLFYAEEFRRTEQWERLWLWLDWLLPKCKKNDQQLFQTLCGYATEAAKALGREDEWMETLAAMLPQSYYVYSEFLIKSGRFRQWVNYHLLENSNVYELYPTDLRTIELHDPKLVFPLYHQSVERCVVQKNRIGYKEAIRLLKKLEALYAQIGQQERYELYLRMLSQQYSRLRAFREELMKGKMLR
ncbi:MAG: hypothetical protein K0Q59_4786 [Paenibacillus sp.]|nr:hypothetical protein [Paenibacillus sp.]